MLLDFLRHVDPHSPGSRSKRRICPIALDVVRFILGNGCPAVDSADTCGAVGAVRHPSGGRKPMGQRGLVTLPSSMTTKFQRPLGQGGDVEFASGRTKAG